MKDWIHFVTILGTVIIVLIMISSLYGCTSFNIIKETAKVVDIITPDKKEYKLDGEDFKSYIEEAVEKNYLPQGTSIQTFTDAIAEAILNNNEHYF